MRVLSAFIGLLLCIPAFALDFVADGQLNTAVERGYRVKKSDRFNGHPVFIKDDWLFVGSQMEGTTGGDVQVRMPFVVMEAYANGNWIMSQVIAITMGHNNTNGWSGDPCGGGKIIKINRVRRHLDRCASAGLNSLPIGGKDVDTLELVFTESNTGGRYYSLTFNVAMEASGLSKTTVTETRSDFNSRLKEWMERMLDAVVLAADYDKPATAFNDVSSLSTLLRGAYGLSRDTSPDNIASGSALVKPVGNGMLAMRWDGYSNLMLGAVDLYQAGRKGDMKVQLSKGEGECVGAFEAVSKDHKQWFMSCANGMKATGTFEFSGQMGDVVGSGFDDKGKRVEFTIGSIQ